MALNEWWGDDPEQSFWMEATKRPVVGDDVRAPTTGTKGQSFWSYDLVTLTKPGDIVFHWHTTKLQHSALIGWSEVVDTFHMEDDYWAPQSGPGAKKPVLKPHWVVPLGGLNEYASPIYLDDLRGHMTEVLGVGTALEVEHGKPVYFPFNKYDNEDSLRAMQGYFTKFPKQLVALLGRYFDLLPTSEPSELDVEIGQAAAETKSGKKSGQGFVNDVRRKLAIEQRAVDVAVDLYKSLGVKDYEIRGKPYDLHLTLDGEEVHVEVKGSSHSIDSVFVTSNEVEHAHSHFRTELVVVDSIELTSDSSGELVAAGGTVRRWKNWKPSPESLVAKTFRHQLPAEAGAEVPEASE